MLTANASSEDLVILKATGGEGEDSATSNGGLTLRVPQSPVRGNVLPPLALALELLWLKGSHSHTLPPDSYKHTDITSCHTPGDGLRDCELIDSATQASEADSGRR